MSSSSHLSGSPTLSVIVPAFNERPNVAPMIRKLDSALAGIAWEVIYVDDDSPDGTAAEVRRMAAMDSRVRCIRRIGRRGLASAVIEGALSSSADYVAVIDGDLQHDETRLPVMLEALRSGAFDLVVASRHVAGGDNAGLANRWRRVISDGGIWLAQKFLPVPLSDPMSGFFMMPRPMFEDWARNLTGQGFKILLDLVLSAPAPPRIKEIPARFRERVAGESKLDALVMMQFGGLLLDKVFGGLLPLRFLSFALVGALGVLVHLAVLTGLREGTELAFQVEQTIATVVAMVFNFQLNNAITYREQRLRGPRLWRGLVLFMLVCGVGAIANIGIANSLYRANTAWTIAGAVGAVIGVVWNYAVSATLVWRAR
ncbi:MAG: glycosyltransferase [Acetobacteraceae bacterium]